MITESDLSGLEVMHICNVNDLSFRFLRNFECFQGDSVNWNSKNYRPAIKHFWKFWNTVISEFSCIRYIYSNIGNIERSHDV